MDHGETAVDRLLKRLTPEQRLGAFNILAQQITDEEFDGLEDAEELVVDSSYSNEEGELTIAQQAKELINEPDKVYGLASGFSNLDAITRGMTGGDLIVFGAETGVGKTLIAQNILHNLGVRQIPSLFISLELSNPESHKRYIEMHMDYKAISKEEATKQVNEMSAKYLKYFNPGKKGATIERLRSALEIAKERDGIQIALVDHIHYFSRSATNTSGEIGYIIRELKTMARYFDIPIMAISHLRKLAKPGKMPDMNDLRDSSFIGQDADIVIMMARKKLSLDPIERKTLEFTVQKNRPRSLLGPGTMMISDNYKLTEGNYYE